MSAGRVCVVTGATSGIGLEIALGLAARGCRVVGLGRSRERCDAAADLIRRASPAAEQSWHVVELSRQAEIRALGGRLRGELGRLDVIVNNAATFAGRRRLTPEGIELQTAVNWLAPFLMVHELMPLLSLAPEARVVTMSSGTQARARRGWRDRGRGPYLGLRVYGWTKMACVHFTTELARRLGPGSRVGTYAVDPGLVRTDMGLKNVGGLIRLIWALRRRGGVTPAEGARTALRVSLDADLAARTGLYWKHGVPREPGPEARDAALAAETWVLAEELCGIEPGRYGQP